MMSFNISNMADIIHQFARKKDSDKILHYFHEYCTASLFNLKSFLPRIDFLQTCLQIVINGFQLEFHININVFTFSPHSTRHVNIHLQFFLYPFYIHNL